MRIVSGVLELAGFVALGYGLWQHAPWLAFVVCGSLLLIGGVMVDLMSSAPKKG